MYVCGGGVSRLRWPHRETEEKARRRSLRRLSVLACSSGVRLRVSGEVASAADEC